MSRHSARRISVVANVLVCATAWPLAAATAAQPAPAPAGRPGEALAPSQRNPAGQGGVFVPATIARKGEINFMVNPDREGLVAVRFCASPEGKVTDVEVLPSGFHVPAQVDETVRYIRTLEFTPATLDGAPAESCMSTSVTFARPPVPGRPAPGVSREFRTALAKVTQLVKDGDNAAAYKQVDAMLEQHVKLLYEYGFLQATLADAQVRAGNVHRAIEAAREATARRSSPFPIVLPGEPLPAATEDMYIVQKSLVIDMLKMRLSLSAQNGLLLDALQAYYELVSLAASPAGDPSRQTGELVEKAFAAKGDRKGKLVVGERATWRHPLSRSAFTLDGVEGKVESMALSCAGHAREMKYQADVEWSVPAKWGDCFLVTKATPGTKFTIVEFAEEAPASR